MEYHLDDYSLSTPLPSYSSALRDLPPVPSFRNATRPSRRISTTSTRGGPSPVQRNGAVHIHAAHLKYTDSSSPHADNWATLKVQSKSAKLPVRIAQTHPLKGFLEIDLQRKAKSMECITAALHGEITLTGESTSRFLCIEEILWRSTSNHHTLTGQHSLPFEFYLPAYVSIPKYTPQEVELPFSDTAPFSISYKLIIKMIRGRFKSNSLIEMPLLLLPSSSAKSASRQRQLAYRETRVPPGPIHDPEGWFSLGQVTHKGTIFGARVVNVAFKCHLANPLSYAKGTAIPFIIAVISDDAQALDLISSRDSLSVSLTKKNQMHPDSVKMKGPKNTTVVGLGSFCPPGADYDRSVAGWRIIEGEIHIAGHETPSFETTLLTCSHTVNVHLHAIGFAPLSRSKGHQPFESISTNTVDFTAIDESTLLFSQSVTITTFPCSGPQPTFRTKPVYPAAHYADCSQYSLGAYAVAQILN